MQKNKLVRTIMLKMENKEPLKFALLAAIALLALPANAQKTVESEQDFAAGKKIYMSNCEVCHLVGRNLVKPTKEIQNSKIIDDPKVLKEFLSHKNGIMPAFTELSKNEKHILQLRMFLEHARMNPSHVDGPEKKSDVNAESKATVASPEHKKESGTDNKNNNSHEPESLGKTAKEKDSSCANSAAGQSVQKKQIEKKSGAKK